MKTKKLLPLLFVTALLTSCNSEYIECSSISVNNSTSYYRNEGTITLVARYELAEYAQLSYIYPETSGRYYAYFYYNYSVSSLDTQNQKLLFPQNGTFYDSNQGKSINMRLVSSTNKYSSYTKVFYSQKSRTIKIEDYRYKAVSAPNDKLIQTKTAIYFSIYEGMESLDYTSRDYYGNYQSIITSTIDTFVDAGDNVVTYTPYVNNK